MADAFHKQTRQGPAHTIIGAGEILVDHEPRCDVLVERVVQRHLQMCHARCQGYDEPGMCLQQAAFTSNGIKRKFGHIIDMEALRPALRPADCPVCIEDMPKGQARAQKPRAAVCAMSPRKPMIRWTKSCRWSRQLVHLTEVVEDVDPTDAHAPMVLQPLHPPSKAHQHRVSTARVRPMTTVNVRWSLLLA